MPVFLTTYHARKRSSAGWIRFNSGISSTPTSMAQSLHRSGNTSTTEAILKPCCPCGPLTQRLWPKSGPYIVFYFHSSFLLLVIENNIIFLLVLSLAPTFSSRDFFVLWRWTGPGRRRRRRILKKMFSATVSSSMVSTLYSRGYCIMNTAIECGEKHQPKYFT